MANFEANQTGFDDFLNVYAIQLASKLQLLIQRKVLRPAGVSLQEWRILFSLARYGDSHLRLLSERGAMDVAHASRTATQLEQKGLVCRRDDPADQRRRLVILTPAGRLLFNRLWPEARRISDQVGRVYTAAEFKKLKSLLKRALHHAGELLEDQPANDTTASPSRVA